MKVCSSCGFKMLDNQKYCPRCGLPTSFKPPIDTSENIINNEREEKEEKLGIINNGKSNIKRTIIIINIVAIILLGGIILFLTILNKDNSDDLVKPNIIIDNTEEDEYSKLKDIITYVKNEFANIMKSENIVFIKFDESDNRYLFESTYESSQEQYYYYPETNEITINVPGAELIINQDFSFKTTFWGEPSDEDYYWQSSIRRTTYYEELVKINESMDNIAKNMFSDMLDYAISPYLECEIDGIELYLVRVNKGEPNYEVNEFLLGSDGEIYDYWEAVSNNTLVKFE